MIAALGITWSTVGALLAIRRPDNPVGGIMILVGCGLAISVLAAIFGGAVVSSSAALSSFAQGETIAVAASTLAAFAAFQPVLRRVRREMDRRFDRAGYDAERTIAKFSDRLRDQIDLADLSSDLDATIREVIAPRSLGIWIRRSPPTSP